MFTWALKLVGGVLARRLTNETLRAAFKEAELRRQLESQAHDRAVRSAELARLQAALRTPERYRGAGWGPIPGADAVAESVTESVTAAPVPALPAPEPTDERKPDGV